MKQAVICFDRKEHAELQTQELSLEPAAGQVLVKSDFDLISAGTELANYRDLPNCGGSFPRYPGYSVSGHVVKVGDGVETLKDGDNVVIPWSGHRSWFVKDAEKLYKVPSGVSQQVAAFAHLASFPFLGVRKLNLQMGESAMVAGLGLLGMLAVQYARLAGACPVLACDFSPERRDLALRLGADYVLDPGDPDFLAKVMELTEGNGVDGVVEVTGAFAALKQALKYVACQGRITLLGCTRVSGQGIDYYQDIHRHGVSIIGAHTMTRPHCESRPGQWTEFDDYRTFFRYVKTGRIQVEPIIHRVVSPRDATEVYAELASLPDPPCGVLFDWRDVE
ncbi:MAG: zinc-binding alcohol dehydrogenase [Victivallales bacterium]|nr:zinc-binding alcohol dehydrogenase [Victivallales bacterium]